MDNEIMTLKEVAKYLRMSEFSIYRLLKENQIPGFKLRGQWRFKKPVIDKWIESKMENHKENGANDNNSNSKP